MSDIVKILYNHLDAFGPQPTPEIGVEYESVYAGEYWGRAETMTLQGQLTGCTFTDIVAAQQHLASSFNQSFQSLEIWQQQGTASGLVYQKDLVEVRSITFAPDRMVGVIPYSISLYCYPSGLFSGAFGVLDPSDTWAFTEQGNEVLIATHTISCRGFNTSRAASNALDNARSWAFGRSGTASMPVPILISGVNLNYFCCLTQAESIDRFNGTYTLTENWTNDLARTGYGVIRYTADVTSGNNVITVNLQGTAEGCGRNISGTREALTALDTLGMATKAYMSVFGRNDLNPVPVDQVYTEDSLSAHIDFSLIYDNDNYPRTFFDYTVDCDVGTNGTITTNIQGTINYRAGNLVERLVATQAYADSLNLYILVLPFYQPFDISSFLPLNPIPVVSGRSINESNGTVNLNATFNNQDKVSDALDQFNYTLQFTPQVEKVDSRPKLDGTGSYSIVDLGFANRASLSINGNAIVNRNYLPSVGAIAVKQACYDLLNQYGRINNTVIEQNSITTDRTDDRTLAFTFTWSFDSPNTIGPLTIPTLSV